MKQPFSSNSTIMAGAMLAGVLSSSAWLACGGDSEAVGPGPGTGAATTSSGGTAPGGAGGAGAMGGAGGSATTTTGGSGGSGGSGGAAAVTDFLAPGAYAVESTDGELTLEGCGFSDRMTYTLFEPTGVEAPLLVVLGHGFQRSRANVAEMAAAFASHGVRVVTPDYCHASITDSDPAQNAADQIALADAIDAEAPRIHAGHSAGGLASILAAEADANAVALLALDAVDRNELGVGSAPNVTVPTFGIDGDPHSCNEQNNDGTHLAKLVPGGTAVHVVGATHCDFEGPTNVGCTLLCGGEGADGQSALIRALATAFVAWQADVDPTGEDWVTAGGGTYQTLVTDGTIEAL